ncbi:hypothetical protein ABIE66_006026 [Peribacillus sp. B2I2]
MAKIRCTPSSNFVPIIYRENAPVAPLAPFPWYTKFAVQQYIQFYNQKVSTKIKQPESF